jgi:hypothetical protein
VREARRLDRYRVPVIAIGLTLSIVGGLVLVPRILHADDREAATVSGPVRGLLPVPAGLDWERAKTEAEPAVDCVGEPVENCIVVHGTGPHILLIGDSHARMLLTTFKVVAKEENLTLSFSHQERCPWQNGLLAGITKASRGGCRKHHALWYQHLIPELNPDIIVVVGRSLDDPKGKADTLQADGPSARVGSAEYQQMVQATTESTLKTLRRDGRKVVIVDPVPLTGLRVPDCLSDAKYLEQCRSLATEAPTASERYYRGIAKADDQVWLLNLDKAICPYLPICDPVVNGMIVRSDSAHLTLQFARSLAPQVKTFLDDNRLLTR